MAAATKISIRFLRAIESEDFEKLPGGIFSTSYLRQYAAFIGYDEETLLSQYYLKMNIPVKDAEQPQPETGGRTRLDRWLRMPAQVSRQL